MPKSGVDGGSWGVTSGAISKVTIGITHIMGLITPLLPTHEPPTRLFGPLAAACLGTQARSSEWWCYVGPSATEIWEFPKIRGTLFRGP